MVSFILFILCGLYLIWFYVHKSNRLKELKTQYPPFVIDSIGKHHYYVRVWHYVKNRAALSLYNNPTQEIRPLVTDGTKVWKGMPVIEIVGNVHPVDRRPKIVRVTVSAFSEGFFYCTQNVYSISSPLNDGSELFVIEPSRRKTKEESDQERIASWPAPIESSGKEVVLSSRLFSDADKAMLNSTGSFCLILDEGIDDHGFVRTGQRIGKVATYSSYGCYSRPGQILDVPVYAHCNGFLFPARGGVKVNDCLAKLYSSIEDGIEGEYPIETGTYVRADEFTSVILVDSYPAISFDGKVVSSFEYANGTACLRIVFETKELSLQKGDSVDCLFTDSKLHFVVDRAPVRDMKDAKKRVCFLSLSQSDLNLFASQYLLKVRINSREQDVITIENKSFRYPDAVSEYYLAKSARMFRDKLNELGLVVAGPEKVKLDEETGSSCFVYIMRDETNGAHKIGISNKPEY